VVNRNFKGAGKSKVPRGVKMVDSRLKKDVRAQKVIAKKNKGRGISKKSKGIKKR